MSFFLNIKSSIRTSLILSGKLTNPKHKLVADWKTSVSEISPQNDSAFIPTN